LETATAPAKLSKAAVAGLVFSVLGLAFFPLSVLGLLLGGVGFAKTRPGTLRGRGVAILALVLAPLTIATSALEVQRFGNGFGAQTMTYEARMNLVRLTQAIEASRKNGGRLPPALPLTPSQVPCGASPQPWPQDAALGWSALGFAPDQPLRYSYEYVPDPDGKSFTVRARGDLNCDGKTSLFESRPGQLRPRVENELE
jgi:hypothetical protein